MIANRNDENLSLIFTIETNIKNVMNKIRLTTLEDISSAEIRYEDSYGYGKISKLLSSEILDGKIELTFEKFYAKKFDLVIYDEISENTITGIDVVPLNQYEFYEDKDVDVRLDKTIMIAESHCGQHASNSADRAIDGTVDTYFHSAGYSGSYADFTLQLGKEYLIDRVHMVTRSATNGSGNGRILAYQVLYKTSRDEEWQKVFEQLTEEVGDDRYSFFKPVLATEICIRVTNGKNRYVMIHEMDVFKHNLIEERISNLFTDESELELKEEVTLEEIERIQSELQTKSYLDRIDNAKNLYQKRVIKKIYEIPLSEERIFDKVYFKTDKIVLEADIKYIDLINGTTKLLKTEIIRNKSSYTLNIEKIKTSKAELIVYGIDNIEDIETNKYISKNTMTAKSNISTWSDCTPEKMLDNNEETYFHSNRYSSDSYGDVYLSLEKPEIISKIEFKTAHPSGSNGQIHRYEILYKEDSLGAIWKSLYKSEVITSKGWRVAEFEPTFMSDLCIRVYESYGSWILINEIEISTSKSEIKDSLLKVYTDISCTRVKDNIKLRDINSLIEAYPDSILGMKAKILWLNDNVLEVLGFSLDSIDDSYQNYAETLRVENCLDLISTSYKFEKKTDYLIESSRDIKMCIISDDQEGPLQNIMEIKSGKNMIYTKAISGDIFILREDTEALGLSLYNVKKSENHYKIGEYDVSDLFKRKDREGIISLEGKNFIIRGEVSWLLQNLDENEFVDGMANLDHAIDYLGLLIDKNQSYTTDYKIPNLKRVFWQNLSGKTAVKSTDKGCYIEFNKELGFLLQDNIENIMKEELSELLSLVHVSKEIYSPGIYSILKTILKKIILLKNQDYIDIPTTPLESLATKLLLFANNDRIITYIYKNLQKQDIGQSNSRVLSKICLWITEFLQRDISSYFTSIGIEIEADILVECNTYIQPKIDLNEITFLNHKELVKEELDKFNESYISLVNRNGGDTIAK
ncbi:MAG: discoidin domain-containing protein [Cetobacterium sp.]